MPLIPFQLYARLRTKSTAGRRPRLTLTVGTGIVDPAEGGAGRYIEPAVYLRRTVSVSFGPPGSVTAYSINGSQSLYAKRRT